MSTGSFRSGVNTPWLSRVFNHEHRASIGKHVGRRRVAVFMFGSLTISALLLYLLVMNMAVPGDVTTDDEASPPIVAPTQAPQVEPTQAPQVEFPDLGQGPHNSTLGFEKIFYISMPERTDRRDMMTLISSYLNLDFTVIDAVNGSTIVDKALPYDIKDTESGEHITTAELGCWRAHVNVWSQILSSGISSALIMEDDADFSVGIRDILEGVSTQLQGIFGAKNKEPYGIVGDSWDVLALGSCFADLPDPKKEPKVARWIRGWVDPYAPENDDLSKRYLPRAASKRVRVVGPAKFMACTQGYAVTRLGAMRLLYNSGGVAHSVDNPVDIIMGNQMKNVLYGFVTLPSIVTQWKNGDWRDTDIQKFAGEESRKMGQGDPDIVQSVRKEIMDVLGNRNVWEEIEKE